MAGSLIRLNKKHISVDQMTMSVDQVLQCYIRNMPGPPSSLIENYLQEAERWRPETYTFHLPCGECTITLEDVQLQLGLPVDGYAVTESTQSADWGVVYYELLGAILDKINGGRIEMGWLRDTFPEPDNESTELERIRHAWAYILKMIGATLYREMCGVTRPNKAKIGGCLSLLQSWAQWNHSASYVGIPTSLEGIWLLLDQRLEAQFQWTPYEDPAIRAVILDEFFQNLNIWHVKVPLVNYAIVEMHQFRQPIPVEPEVLDDEHKVNLWLLNTDWPRHWSEYIEMWENRYDYIPTWEPIIVPELVCVPEYMPWLRIHGKPYLLSEEERRRQIHVPRERRGPLNSIRRDDDAGPSTAPTQSPGPLTAPKQPPGPTLQPTTPISQPFQIMSGAYSSPYMYPNPFMFPFPSPMAGWNSWPSSSLFPITPSQPPIIRPPSHKGSQEAPPESSFVYQSPSPYGIQTPPPWLMQTPPHSLFYQGGSSSQHPQPDPLPEEPQSPPVQPQPSPEA
ncbi:hypothetical protein CXB51_026633 [Gossypium anomalum]|uniref:Aminotransferase-like plant mobile domain-containing protein n=1 Tax=Gossypium anomalum TaxID=47600 RepID=A0A8J5YEG8_9ROSI|nr:hypothetical protein CXB51_026633 [Gossypium anomalum]